MESGSSGQKTPVRPFLKEFLLKPEYVSSMKQDYEKHRHIIDKFNSEVKNILLDKDRIFFEFVFCLCTPQSKAVVCRDAVRRMETHNLLRTGAKHQLLNCMQGIRFNGRKSDYIIRGRRQFSQVYAKIMELKGNPQELRGWLAGNVTGYGMKEASHFLRNIGLGRNLAILDVHIMREMHQLGIVENDKSGLQKNTYLETEARFASLAKALNMAIAELDCTIWLSRSGSGELM